MFRSQPLGGLALAMIVAPAVWSGVDRDSRASVPVVGQPAPNIQLKKLLNAPKGAQTSWDALRGKVVVLEFWSTYCAPCVANLPAMNKLESLFDSDPVVFIHITDEDEATVRKFLKNNRIHGWVGIDGERATLKKYGVSGLPRLAIVGTDGRFLGWSRPFKLVNEPEILREALDKGSSPELWETQGESVDPLSGVPRDGLGAGGDHNLCDIVIRRSTRESAARAGGGDSRGSWSFDKTLLEHIRGFCGVPAPRIVTAVPLPEEHYDIIALNREAGMAAIEDIVCRLIGVTVAVSMKREKRLMDAYVLRLPAGRRPVLTPSLGGVYTDQEAGLHAPSKEVLERMKKGETFFFMMGPLDLLADSVSGALGKPVVPELGTLPEEYDDYYTICFPCDTSEPASVIKALGEHVGFTVVPQRREVEVLVIGNADREQSPADRP